MVPGGQPATSPEEESRARSGSPSRRFVRRIVPRKVRRALATSRTNSARITRLRADFNVSRRSLQEQVGGLGDDIRRVEVEHESRLDDIEKRAADDPVSYLESRRRQEHRQHMAELDEWRRLQEAEMAALKGKMDRFLASFDRSAGWISEEARKLLDEG